MKKMLNERAEEEGGKRNYPVNEKLKIKPAALQLSTKVERSLEGMERYGHYKKRDDFEKVIKKTESDITFRDVFKEAKKNADEKSKQETTELATRKFVERRGNIVGMIGQAGIGKTMLTRIILQSITEREMLPETQFIFYIPFRDVDFVSETTLMKFALTGCFGWEHTEDSERKLLKVIEENENVVFIFDGLDEANTDGLPEPKSDYIPSQKHTPGLFVAKILMGKLFPKAKKLITSRPRQFFKLHPDYRRYFVVDILGLNEEAQEDLCKQICGKSSDDVMKYLKSNPDIFSCCYVPVNCIMTMSIINETLKQHGTVSVISLTDIFVRALEIFVESEHMRNCRNEVWKLSKLAWDGLLSQKIVFGEADFTEAQIDQTAFQAFLCTYVKGEIRGNILEGKKKSSFSHLTWQELFAAIYLVMFHPLPNFLNLLKGDKLGAPLWEVVSKFLFGLCNLKVMDRLESIFYPKIAIDWDKKQENLFSSLRGSLQKGISSNEEQFRLFSWIREADNSDLNTLIAKHIPQQVIFPSSMLLTDAVSAVYVLKHTATSLNIKIEGGLNFSILDYVCSQFESFPVKVTSVNLSHYGFGDNGARKISKCLKNANEWNLSWCEITSDDAEEIARQLIDSKGPRVSQIASMDLSNNDIGDNGARHISKCLKNVNEWNLSGCEITSVGTEEIARQLDDFKVTSMNLSNNDIGDNGARHLAKCLKNVNEWNLSWCKITSVGAEEIASHLKESQVKYLNLSNNNIGDDGVRAIAKCLKNLDVLDLACCRMSAIGAKEIATQLKENKIDFLNIYSNKIGDDGAKAIAKCLSSVNELNVGKCSITSVGAEEIASQLKECKLYLLNLSKNKIGDDGARIIAKRLHSVDCLDLCHCDITSVGAQEIARQLKECKVKSLDLSFNDIHDEGARAIGKYLTNVEELDLSNCSISPDCAKEIEMQRNNCKVKV